MEDRDFTKWIKMGLYETAFVELVVVSPADSLLFELVNVANGHSPGQFLRFFGGFSRVLYR